MTLLRILSFNFEGSFALLFLYICRQIYPIMARFKKWEKLINWAVTVATALASCYNLVHCGQLFN
jgi:hypothetical protein